MRKEYSIIYTFDTREEADIFFENRESKDHCFFKIKGNDSKLYFLNDFTNNVITINAGGTGGNLYDQISDSPVVDVNEVDNIGEGYFVIASESGEETLKIKISDFIKVLTISLTGLKEIKFITSSRNFEPDDENKTLIVGNDNAEVFLSMPEAQIFSGGTLKLLFFTPGAFNMVAGQPLIYPLSKQTPANDQDSQGEFLDLFTFPDDNNISGMALISSSTGFFIDPRDNKTKTVGKYVFDKLGSASSQFPNGIELITESRPYLSSDAGKLLILATPGIQVGFSNGIPFNPGETVSIMSGAFDNSFQLYEEGPFIKMVEGTEGLPGAEIVKLECVDAYEQKLMVCTSTFIIDDAGQLKTGNRYLFDHTGGSVYQQIIDSTYIAPQEITGDELVGLGISEQSALGQIPLKYINGIITIHYGAAEILIANNKLQTGRTYIISDKEGQPELIATSTNTFAMEGNGIFPVVDFDNKGIYTGYTANIQANTHFSGNGLDDLEIIGSYNGNLDEGNEFYVQVAEEKCQRISFANVTNGALSQGNTLFGNEGSEGTIIELHDDYLIVKMVDGNFQTDTHVVTDTNVEFDINGAGDIADYFTLQSNNTVEYHIMETIGVPIFGTNLSYKTALLGHTKNNGWDFKIEGPNYGFWNVEREKDILTIEIARKVRFYTNNTGDLFNGANARTNNSRGLVYSVSANIYIEYIVLEGNPDGNIWMEDLDNPGTYYDIISQEESPQGTFSPDESLYSETGVTCIIESIDIDNKYVVNNISEGTFKNSRWIRGNSSTYGVLNNYSLRAKTGDVFIYNNAHYLVSDNNYFSGNTPNINDDAYQLIAKNNNPYFGGYLADNEKIIYDFVNDDLKWRMDKFGNKIPKNSFETFQWGDEKITDVVIESENTFITTINNIGNISGKSKGNNANINLDNNTGNIFFDITGNSQNLYIPNNDCDTQVHLIGWNVGLYGPNMGGGEKVFYLYNSSYVNTGFALGTIKARYYDQCMVDHSGNRGEILWAEFSKGTQCNLSLQENAYHRYNKYSAQGSYVFPETESYEYKELTNSNSTFNITALTGGEEGEIYVSNFAGIINVHFNGIINKITGGSTMFPITIMPDNECNITIQNTDYSSIDTGLIVMESSNNLELIGRNEGFSDFIIIKGGQNDSFRQIGGSKL